MSVVVKVVEHFVRCVDWAGLKREAQKVAHMRKSVTELTTELS